MLARITPAVSLFLVAAVFGIQTGSAQEARGAIIGRVTDSSGGVVPGAAVRVTNLGTSVALPTVTNDQGNYTAPFLTPGMYRVSVEKTGFKRVVRDGLEVRVNDRLEVNLSMEVGEMVQTVNVNTESPLLDTATASVGQVVDPRLVAELPIAHGNPFHLIRLSAGMSVTGAVNRLKFDTAWEPQFTTQYAAAGSDAYSSEFTMDGVSNTNTELNKSQVSAAYTPPSDAVAEFKVQTAVFDASMGQTSGSVVNVSIKSGSNAPHGTGYWARLDPSWNANQFFANRAGQPRTTFEYNRWGGTFSGPIVVPKVYNGKSRTFFMFAYEGVRQTSPLGSTLTVPTAEQRNGDFSGLLRLSSTYQIYDPFTRQTAPGGRFSIQPLPGNIVPASRISPVAKNLLSYFPAATQAGTVDGGNNYPQEGWPQRIKYHNFLYRFDHNLSEKNRAFLRVNSWNRISQDSDWFGFDNPSRGVYFWQDQIGFVFDDVHIFSPSLVMNTRVSDSQFVRAQDSSLAGRDFDITKLGFPASLRDAIDPSLRRFPYININGYTGFGPRTILNRPVETRTAGVTLTKVLGSHDLKFGGEYRQYVENQAAGTNGTGMQLTFTEAYTRGPLDNSPAAPRGQALASMLFGVVASGNLDKVDNYAELSTVWGGFIQDDWKITRKLTLNIGLRYEVEGPLTERFNRSVRAFDQNAQQAIEAQAKANYAKNPTPEVPPSQFSVRGGLTFAGVNGQPRTLWGRDTNNFMPRIGAAYSLNRKTVLRGGYGFYYGPLGARRGDVIQTGFSRSTLVVTSLDGGLTFKSTLANPFPDGILQPSGAADGAATNMGQAITFFKEDPRAVRSEKWMFSVQRELPGRLMAEARYLGSRGSDVEFDRALSALPVQYLSATPTRDQATIDYLSANLPNPFNGLLPGTARDGALIGRAALLAPYPHFTGVTTSTNEGKSWYNSLNLEVQRRFSRGFTMQGAYTWSKYIVAASLLNAGDPTPERVISPQDYPHRLSLTWVYELPFGRGRPLLNRSHRAVDAVFGGWQLAGIYTAQSGDALGFGDAILYGTLKDIPLPESERTVDRWFNTDVFERRSAQQLASHRRIMSSRFNGIRSDGINYWDMSLLKNTNVTERVKFELRVEALNVFNHVSFFTPSVSPIDTAFGKITAEKSAPRRVQLTLRVKF